MAQVARAGPQGRPSVGVRVRILFWKGNKEEAWREVPGCWCLGAFSGEPPVQAPLAAGGSAWCGGRGPPQAAAVTSTVLWGWEPQCP